MSGSEPSPLERLLAADRRLKQTIAAYESSVETADQNGTTETVSKPDPWPVMAPEAYHGLVGEFVRTIEPYSEADPVGILLHMLAGAGCLIGSGPHFMVEHAPHHVRLNVIFVGLTSKGRKGTSWSTPRYVLSRVDEQWVGKRVKSGLSSGEGLIFQVRDPQYEKVPIREGGKQTGKILGYEDILTDPGEEDKRLLIIQEEFSNTLRVMEREGNTLSPVIRDSWDHGNLSPLTKKDRISATGAHICIIGHTTKNELLRYLTLTERGNGFANRFLFVLVKRSKCIPSGQGAPPSILEPYITRFSRTIERARTGGRLARDPEAEALWAEVYEKLSEEIPGLTGAILARAEAQVLRLSMVYSLLDEKEADSPTPAIRPSHLLAALAVWDYCKTTTRFIFGDAIGDSVADRLLREIKTSPKTDSELYDALGRHDGERKDPALDLLIRLDRAHSVSKPTAGRPIREWHFGTVQGCALCAKSV